MGKSLKAEKSKLTKSGPKSGALFALPKVPGGAWTKQLVLKKSLMVCGCPLGSAPLQTWFGRFCPALFPPKAVPELFTVVMKSGNPEVIRAIALTCQLPSTASVAPLRSLRERATLPNGKL